MRKLLTIKYDGTNYHGWQVQSNAITVQEVLQNAFEKMFGERYPVSGCSRTDSGVHANMFCCHFDTEKSIGNYNIAIGLNTYLPSDIAVINCADVDSEFHARYSCKGKEYIYKIYNSKIRDPFLTAFSYQYYKPLNIELMNRAAKHFLGKHDFGGFCSIKSDVEDTVREIKSIDIKKDGELVTFSVTGDGFLYNMVRIIVGTLIFVSEGKISPDDIEDIILSKDRNRAGKTVPPHGLYLNRIFY